MKTSRYEKIHALMSTVTIRSARSITISSSLTLLLLMMSFYSFSQSCGCNFTIAPTATPGIITWDGGPSGFNVQPGQTICFQATTYFNTIRLKNIKGTATNRITIKNCGGQTIIDNVNDGRAENYTALEITGSEYFILTGDGAPGIQYGIKVAGSEIHGLHIAGYSTDFEVKHLEIANTDGCGINAKTDPSCSNPDIRWFTQRNSFFHDNYLHHIGLEGFYVGYTHYPDHTNQCSDPNLVLRAGAQENIRIYNNRLEYIAWDAIQVSAFKTGNAIYGNIIREYATERYSAHIHAIQLSDNSDQCDVYDNQIMPITSAFAGEGHALASWAERVKFYNNLVVKTERHAIQIYDEADGDGYYHIMNNTVIDPGAGVLEIYGNAPDIKVQNNIFTHPQGTYITDIPASAVVTNNYMATSTAGSGLTADYHLSSSSPPTILDAGLNVYSYGVTKDFDDQARPSSGPFDIGADEFIQTSSQVVKINFRGTDPAPLEAEWNDWNVMPTTLAPAPTLTNIKYTNGNTTGYTATLSGKFNGANGLGMTGTGVYPSQVMQTNWYIHNISATPGAVTLSGLDNSKRYSFKFFGSRKDVNGTIDRTTEYAIGSTVVTLNASNNATATANINDVAPVGGSITFTVKYGPGVEFGYINALEMTEAPAQLVKNIKVNFRGTDPVFSDPAWNDWNAMPTTTTPAPTFTNLKYADGSSSNYNLVLTTRFSGANGLGMTGSGVYPSQVMQTNWYVYNNTPTPGVFNVTGLDDSKIYTFRFFGSREDPSGTTNRNTDYTIGSTTVTLNASNNTTETIEIENVAPTNGVITVTVKYGTGASFGYLNAMEIFEYEGGTSMAMREEPEVLLTAPEDKESVSAYPVPFDDRITLTITEKIKGNVSITFIGVDGRGFFQKAGYDLSDGGVIELDLADSNIPRGLHILRIQSDGGFSRTIRVAKK
jgi:hypothetical protein